MNRNLILNAAAEIFGQKGYHAASMQDIASAVHLQKGSLYHHVASKQQLLVEILDQALDLLSSEMQTVLSLPCSPVEKLQRALASYLVTLTAHQDLAAVLILEHRSLDEAAKAVHYPRRDQLEKMWRDLIQEGIDQGIFATSNLPLAARSILAMLNWTITWYRKDGSLSATDIAAEYARLVLNGLLVRPPVQEIPGLPLSER